MNQRELNYAVARATGEAISTIERMGFLLADTDIPQRTLDGPHSDMQIIDWDQLAQLRYAEGEETRSRDLVSS